MGWTRRATAGAVVVGLGAALGGCATPQPWQSEHVAVVGWTDPNFEPRRPVFSPDGRFVAYESTLPQPGAPPNTQGHSQIYVRDLVAGTTEMVSVNAAGTGGGAGASLVPVFSPDSTKVGFSSLAGDLASPDFDGIHDAYVRDLVTDTTTLVTAGTGPIGGTFDGFGPAGDTALLTTNSGDLGPTDTNGVYDVYLKNLTTGAATLVSGDAAGTDALGGSVPQLSPDGSKVLFGTYASGFGPTDTNGAFDIYVRDLAAGTTSLVGVDASGTGSVDRGTAEATFSPDGTEIAFRSRSAQFGPTDTNGRQDVYVRDLVAGTTELVSVNADGTDAAAAGVLAMPGRFGPDGSVAFVSEATDLVPGGSTNPCPNVFLRDRAAGTTVLVSAATDGTGTCNSTDPVFDPDGGALAFTSVSGVLGPHDTNGFVDVYVRNLVTGKTTMVSTDTARTNSGNGPSRLPAIRPGTGEIAFLSNATNLVDPPSDDQLGVFLASPL
jgi:Tol biopolymer transport system component